MIFFSVLSVHLTSSKSLVGITGVVSEIQKEKKVNSSSTKMPVFDQFLCPILLPVFTALIV